MIFALFGTKFCRGIGVGKMGCSDAYESEKEAVVTLMASTADCDS